MLLYCYHELAPTGPLKASFDKVVGFLRTGDFRAADVRKMVGTPFYRARLNDADRLLFRFARYDGQTCLLLLELIRNHAYDKSKFLRGAASAEPLTASTLLTAAAVPTDDVQPLAFAGPQGARFHWLDRPLFFDPIQAAVFDLPTPLLLIGSAGSGKTVLALEKLRTLIGGSNGNGGNGTATTPTRGLYVTRSAHLAENIARLYAENHPAGAADGQEMHFLSLHAFLNGIRFSAGQEMTFRRFAQWFAQYRPYVRIKDAERLFEEFHGVLTGADPTQRYRTLAEYEALGVRQSVFLPNERPDVYGIFQKYLEFLGTGDYFNPNIAAFERLTAVVPSYDFLIADEVQDLTNVQLTLILRALRPTPGLAATHSEVGPKAAPANRQFILCGDAHQVVHPNFFSWSGLKSLFFHSSNSSTSNAGSSTGPAAPSHFLHVLQTNYRNSPPVTALANRLLRIKNLQFGSIDRESTFLVESVSTRPGSVVFIKETAAAQRQLNARIRRSTRFAVVVLREEDKAAARRIFDTPLLFSVQEAKGLEYDNIVLLNVISGHDKLFRDLADGLTPADLTGDLRYARPDRADRHGAHDLFVVNALYVAITRAIHTLFILEHHDQHALLPLLGLTQARQHVGELTAQSSTTAEWRQEARKLEQRGQTEQAAAIREEILAQEPPSWPILTATNLPEEQALAFHPTAYNRKAKDRIFAYALLYHDQRVLNALRGLEGPQKYNPARGDCKAACRHLVSKHYGLYQGDQPALLAARVARYGPDAPDEFGISPLAAATGAGSWQIVAWLRTQGASVTVTDAWGRTPWQYALYAFMSDPARFGPRLGELHGLLAPPTLALNFVVNRELLTVGSIECLLLNYLVFGQLLMMRAKAATDPPEAPIRLIEAADLEAFLRWFPDSVVPARHKTRRYLNALLARHEVGRPHTDGLHLWQRIRPGHYVLNPFLQIEIAPDKWESVQQLMYLVAGRVPKPLIRVDMFLIKTYADLTNEMIEAVQRHKETLKEEVSDVGDGKDVDNT